MPETAIRRIPFPLREGELLRSCHRPPPVRTDRKLSIYERWAQSRCTQCTWIHEQQAKDYLDGAARQRPLECVENVRLFL